MYQYRLRVLLILIFGGCVMVATRLFYLQVIQGEYWQEYANHVLLSRRSLPTYRGRIFAADGTLMAAEMPAFDIAVKLGELDAPVSTDGGRPRSELRARIEDAFKVDGCRVTDRKDIRLSLLPSASGEAWLASLSYSGTIVKRQPPPPVIGLLWKGSRVRQKVSREVAVIPVPETILGRVEKLATASGRSTAELLDAVMQVEEDVLRERASRWEPRPVITDASYDLVLRTEVFEDAFRGFVPVEKCSRRYPLNSLAGHVIGYMGKLTPEDYRKYRREYAGSRAKRMFLSDTIGKNGIELRFDPILRGSRGEELVERERRGQVVRQLSKIDSQPGCDLYLTLMPEQQAAAELALRGRTGAAVVLDAITGEILVLASSPRYNPATISSDYRQLAADPEKPFLHRAIKAYPLGSTFKTITSIAALAQGIDPNITVTCGGTFRIGHPKCSGWHGTISFREAMKRSCNVYFCELGTQAGAESLYEWALKLGLDANTTYELGGEDRGYVPSPSRRMSERGQRWYPGDTANLSIGQGELLVTPLQAARMMAALSTDGRLVQPHIVKKIMDASGREVPVPGRGSIEQQTVHLPAGASARLCDALTAVVHEQGGTARKAFADSQKLYKLAGKTSTAQRRRIDRQTGLPYWDDVGWFVGFAPADKPRMAFAVMIEHLSEGIHGGEMAAPIVRRILESFPDSFMLGTGAPLGGAGGAEHK